MRALVLFALALAGTIASTTDASAFGRRRAAATSGGCYGGGSASPSYGGCYGSYSGSYSGSCYGSGYAQSGYGGCYGSGGYGSYSSGGCYGGGYAQSGSGYRSSMAYGGTAWSGTPVAYSVTYSNGSYATNGGRAAVIRATDGTYYALGADGTYYASSSSGVVLNGATSSSSYTPAAHNGTGVIQASGTAPLSTTTTHTFRAKQVIGTRILIGNNTQVGTVEDMVSDTAGNLDYLVVSTGDGKLVTVPWDAATFDAEKKLATVNVTQQVWSTLPTYTTTTYPQFYTPAYRTDIYKVYGMTPRELRRIR